MFNIENSVFCTLGLGVKLWTYHLMYGFFALLSIKFATSFLEEIPSNFNMGWAVHCMQLYIALCLCPGSDF